MSTSTVTTILTTLVGDMGDILASILPIILGFAVVLTGLFFGVRFLFSRLGGKKKL